MTIAYRQLGKSDLQVSSIGLGCVTFGREIDRVASLEVLDRALLRGINLLDTAAVYGNGASEEIVGRWFDERRVRGRVVLATKVSGRLTRENIFSSVNGSLRRLGTDCIDLLQAHVWDPQTPLEETLEVFEALVCQGKVRCIGCSNWTAPQLQRALSLAERHNWRRLESVQPMYNLADRGIEGDLLPLCAGLQVGVVTYSPLGAGFLTGKYRRGSAVPERTRFHIKPGHQNIYFTDRGFRIVEGLREIARESGLTMVDLALGWVLRQKAVTSVLIGARHPGQVDQAFAAAEAPWDEQLAQKIEQLRSANEEQ